MKISSKFISVIIGALKCICLPDYIISLIEK